MKGLISLLVAVFIFVSGAVVTALIGVMAPNAISEFRDWWRPAHIEACSTLGKSEVTVRHANGEVALVSLYPVDNHFFFYFHNRTGRDIQDPRLFLNLSGYKGRAPLISKMAVLVSSFASKQSADFDWQDKNITIGMDVLPQDSSVLFEMLVWEPIDIHAETLIEGKVEKFYQPADCDTDSTELSLQNISPVYEWSAEECVPKEWGNHCPRPNVDGVVELEQGENFNMEVTVVSKGEFLDPMSATVQFPTHLQLISEFLETGIQVDAFDVLERGENGDITVPTPAINLNVLPKKDE